MSQTIQQRIENLTLYQSLNDDLYEAQLNQIMRQYAEYLSQCEIVEPKQIYQLRMCRDIVIVKVVTPRKLNKFISINQKQLLQNQKLMIKLINIYRIKIINSNILELHQEDYQFISKHIKWLQQKISVDNGPLINNFVRLVLAILKRKIFPHPQFPKYFTSLQHINFKVFFSCALQCIQNWNQYQISNKKLFMSKIITNLANFNLSFQSKAKDYLIEASQICDFLFGIMNIFMSNSEDNMQFRLIARETLILSKAFNAQLLYFMKKFNKEHFFQIWVNFLLRFQYYQSIRLLMQNILYHFENTAERFALNQIISKNKQLGEYWVRQLLDKNQFKQTAKKFLNQSLYTFILFSNVLSCYGYSSEDQFYDMILMVDYDHHVLKFKNHEEAQESVRNLFKLVSDPELIFKTYFDA